MALRLIDAEPPAELGEGRVLIPPNRDSVLVEFELEGETDEKVRVEVFHPDAIEDVTSKVVDGFFEVSRDRRLPRARTGKSSQSMRAVRVETTAVVESPQGVQKVAPEQEWAALVEDEGFRKVLRIIGDQRLISEADLQTVLGSSRRLRAFSRHFDQLRTLVPFEVEITTVQGMKAYVRKD